MSRDFYRNRCKLGSIAQIDTVVPEYFPTNNLVAYYKLDGNSNDSVGSNHGTPSNVSWVGGKIGQAGSFNGSSSKIALPSAVKQSGSFSFACWIQTTGSIASGDIFVDWSFSGRNYAISNSYNKITFMGGDGYTNNGSQIISSALSINTLYHLVITRDGTKNTIYLNGVKDVEQTISYSGGVTSNNIYLGVYSDGINAFFQGYLDEVGIWSRALTTDEISQLYNGGSGITY